MTPASIRNNNPGAMKLGLPGSSARRFGGVHGEILVSEDGRHEVVRFPTMEHGAAAMFHLLHKHYSDRTLQQAIDKWCGKIRSTSYLNLIEQRCDIRRTDTLTKAYLADPQTAIPFAKAMARHEAGQEYPMSDADWLEAHQMAFGSAKAPAPSPTNDVPTMRFGDRVAQQVRRIRNWFALGFTAIGSGGIIGGLQGEDAWVPPPPSGIKQTFVNLSSWNDAIPFHQWQMLAVGSGVFLCVWLLGKLRT